MCSEPPSLRAHRTQPHVIGTASAASESRRAPKARPCPATSGAGRADSYARWVVSAEQKRVNSNERRRPGRRRPSPKPESAETMTGSRAAPVQKRARFLENHQQSGASSTTGSASGAGEARPVLVPHEHGRQRVQHQHGRLGRSHGGDQRLPHGPIIHPDAAVERDAFAAHSRKADNDSKIRLRQKEAGHTGERFLVAFSLGPAPQFQSPQLPGAFMPHHLSTRLLDSNQLPRRFLAAAATLLLTSCGNCTPNTYAVGGNVSGLAGTGLLLQNNAADDLSVTTDGAFTFPTRLPAGAPYDVSVKTHPAAPNQRCAIANGAGTVGASPITNVSVTCTNTYSLAGTISGYTIGGMVLSSPGLPDLPVAEGAATFSFPPLLTAGSTYAVTVKAPPPATTCTITNGTGVVAGADVTSVTIHCTRIWTSISAGGYHTLAVQTDGTLWAWGYNDTGQLGDGTTTDRLSPVQVGSGFASVAAGYLPHGGGEDRRHPLGLGIQLLRPARRRHHDEPAQPRPGGLRLRLRRRGLLPHGGGEDRRHPLGLGTTTPTASSATAPRQTGSAPSRSAPASPPSPRAITTRWREDRRHSLGLGTQLLRPARQTAPRQTGCSPVQVGSGFASVAAGYSHTVAVKTDGTLWAWGHNSYGQLGDGTTTNRLSPVQVGSGFASVAAGYRHTVAVKTDGTLWAWGDNSYGQLGDGTDTTGSAPSRWAPASPPPPPATATRWR